MKRRQKDLFKLPNSIFTAPLNATQLKILAAFYSLRSRTIRIERNAVEGVSRVLQSAQPYYPQRKEVRQDKPEVPEKDVRYKVNADDQRRGERSVQARLHRTH